MLDSNKPIDAVVADARAARDAGFATAGMPQIFGYDALTLLAVVGREVPDIELFVGVVPTYPRHPIMLAAQALTTSAATGGRLVLGIGLSHQIVIEGMFGYSFDKPGSHMEEYLSALMPLLHGEQVDFHGDTITAATMGPIEVDAPAPTVLVAALGPRMLRMAGTMADGTITWMTGPSTLESHIIPRITAAADEAGRPAPRVSVGLPVLVSDDADAARARAAEVFAMYGMLPSYQAMLEREGVDGPAGVAIVGDEREVTAQIQHLADIGVTEFAAAPFGVGEDLDRTVTLLSSLARS